MKTLPANSQATKLSLLSRKDAESLSLPILPFGISAGFPSPALDFMESTIDLNRYLIKHPASTFYGRAHGESMKDAGINTGDILVIDKSIEPRNGIIAVCYLDGEFTLKRIKLEQTGLYLVPENDAYPPIRISAQNELTIWGIVTFVVKKLL